MPSVVWLSQLFCGSASWGDLNKAANLETEEIIRNSDIEEKLKGGQKKTGTPKSLKLSKSKMLRPRKLKRSHNIYLIR